MKKWVVIIIEAIIIPLNVVINVKLAAGGKYQNWKFKRVKSFVFVAEDNSLYILSQPESHVPVHLAEEKHASKHTAVRLIFYSLLSTVYEKLQLAIRPIKLITLIIS